MGAPQIIIIVWFAIEALYAAHVHGKHNEPHSFWRESAVLLLITALLHWGGFWSS